MTLQEATQMLRPRRRSGSTSERRYATLDQRLRRLRRHRAFTRLSSLATLAGWLLGTGALVTIAASGLAIGR